MSFVERITISEDEWERRDIEVLKGRIDLLSKAIAVMYNFENLNCCVTEDRNAIKTALWAMKELINRYNGIIADMRGEERTKDVVCLQCVFWDYEKNRCSEWFRRNALTDLLHRCADMRGDKNGDMQL